MMPQSDHTDKVGKVLTRHIYPGKSTPFSFFDLPGEIRNKVYDLVFDDVSVHLCRCATAQQLEFKRHQKNRRGSSGFRLRCQTIPRQPTHQGNAEETITQVQVLRVCHQMYDEVVPFLYARTILRFDSMKVINKFLTSSPTDGIKAIQKLELIHTTYGEPEYLRFRPWKECHDRKWMRTCQRIAEEMTGITNLKVELRICDWPTQLNLQAAWVRPLLALKNSQDGFENVNLILHHEAFNDQRLRAASRVVAKAMIRKNSNGGLESEHSMAQPEQRESRNGIEGNLSNATKGLGIVSTAAQFSR